MIKKIKSSELDAKKLSEKRIITNNELDEFDFSKVIVKKPWGREYLTYKGDETDIWTLYLKKDAATSMHCHLNKKTNLIVLAGEVISSTLKEDFNLKEGDMVILDEKVFHSTKAISEGGALVMELESPPNKTDLIRLKDIYGRESKGYELQNEMCFDLSEHERVFLNESDFDRKIGNMNISMKDFDDYLTFKNYLKLNKNSIQILIAGSLENKGKKILDVGDMLKIEDLEDRDDLEVKRPLKVIDIKKNILDFD